MFEVADILLAPTGCLGACASDLIAVAHAGLLALKELLVLCAVEPH